jgi:hypothetical protein
LSGVRRRFIEVIQEFREWFIKNSILRLNFSSHVFPPYIL